MLGYLVKDSKDERDKRIRKSMYQNTEGGSKEPWNPPVGTAGAELPLRARIFRDSNSCHNVEGKKKLMTLYYEEFFGTDKAPNMKTLIEVLSLMKWDVSKVILVMLFVCSFTDLPQNIDFAILRYAKKRAAYVPD